MAKRRFTINDDGELEDRDGVVLGKVVGITLDVPTTSSITSRSPVASTSSGPDELVGVGGSSEIKSQETSADGGPPTPSDGRSRVWSHYCQAMKPRHQGLDSESAKIIDGALKVATVSECIGAIDGCKASPFHMGDNDKRRKYNALSQILRGKQGRQTTRERIDFFLDLAQKAGLQPGVPSALNDKVRRARRAVLDAAEFPGDEQVVQRGQEQKAWLESQGWRVDTTQDPVRFDPPADQA